MGVTDVEARRAELAARLKAVRARIGDACAAAGRDPGGVTLVAVTKTFPASDVRLLTELGVWDVGENRDQEARPKAAECADLAPQLTWHFIGQLQTNKASSVARYARVVHAVDRLRLVRALGAAARRTGRVITCLVEVSLDQDEARGGVPEPEVIVIAGAVAAEEGLVLGGVMAMAPLGVPPGPGIRDASANRRRGARVLSGRGHSVGGNERRFGRGHCRWRDTHSRRYGVARRPARLRQVMSVAANGRPGTTEG